MTRNPDGESRGEKVARRLWTIPTRILGLVVVTALFPALLVIALVIDVARAVTSRRPFMATRLLLMGWLYLAGESLFIVAFGIAWLAAVGPRRRHWLERSTWHIQQAWTHSLFGPLQALFGLRLTVEGHDVIEPGPVIVLIRHASIIDNLLPSIVVARPHRVDLRYVLKRELRNDPGIDIGGDRLHNYFVRRDTGEAVERDNVRRLAEGLAPDEGVLLFPEGTRFTPERRERAIARIVERDPALAARAERIAHLLPPKPGGVLAVLDGAPEADVLILTHSGFDGLRLVSDIWHGDLVGREIRVRVTRIPRERIPADRDGRVAWLFDAWQDADRWVGEQLRDST